MISWNFKTLRKPYYFDRHCTDLAIGSDSAALLMSSQAATAAEAEAAAVARIESKSKLSFSRTSASVPPGSDPNTVTATRVFRKFRKEFESFGRGWLGTRAMIIYNLHNYHYYRQCDSEMEKAILQEEAAGGCV